MPTTNVLKPGETPHDYRIRLAEEELSLFERFKVKKLLEVCCGDGKNLVALSRRGFSVTGIESEKKYILAAKKLIAETNVDVHVIHHPVFGERFPFDDDVFDGVFSYQYLNHNFKKEIDLVFEEIYRVLKKGGIFSIKITDIEQFNLKHLKDDLYEEMDPEFPQIKYRKIAPQTFAKLEGDEQGIPHYGFFKNELVASAEKIGFKLINIRTIRWNLVANFEK